VAVAFVLFGPQPPGRTDGAVAEIGEATRFTAAEVEAAQMAVLEKFKDFEGCSLLRIAYDESESDRLAAEHLAYTSASDRGVSWDNVIVFSSDFHVGRRGAESGFNPNQDYSDWLWFVERDGPASTWTVASWGY
jgi:hypothetical protein